MSCIRSWLPATLKSQPQAVSIIPRTSMKQERRRIHAFLLSYYDDYRASAIAEFDNLLALLDVDYTITIINNGSADNAEGPHTQIDGNNRNREFSGWDEALKLMPNIQKNDFFIFCNDTFCHHREWDKQFKSRFIAMFERALKRPGLIICGEVNSIRGPFVLASQRTDRWVSTYLFGMSGSALLSLDSHLSLTDSQLAYMVPAVTGSHIEWGPSIDERLRSHLQTWMFPTESGQGWYNSKNGTDSSNLGKLRCIINEKYISAALLAQGAKIEDLPATSYLASMQQHIKRALKALLYGN